MWSGASDGQERKAHDGDLPRQEGLLIGGPDVAPIRAGSTGNGFRVSLGMLRMPGAH